MSQKYNTLNLFVKEPDIFRLRHRDREIAPTAKKS